MFAQAWKKHLPVIALFLKKSATGEQALTMNYIDFERAAGGKKVKCVFTGVQINNGVFNSASQHTAAAAEFARVLQENPQTELLLRGRRFEFNLNSKFHLTIKDLAAPVATEEEAPEEEDTKEPEPATESHNAE